VTGQPINLNRARKERARKDAKARGDENAARFGRTKTEKALERAKADKADKDLSGHKREP
jgi:hypothetical protein